MLERRDEAFDEVNVNVLDFLQKTSKLVWSYHNYTRY